MGAFVNGKVIPKPYLNGVKHNAYWRGMKIWNEWAPPFTDRSAEYIRIYSTNNEAATVTFKYTNPDEQFWFCVSKKNNNDDYSDATRETSRWADDTVPHGWTKADRALRYNIKLLDNQCIRFYGCGTGLFQDLVQDGSRSFYADVNWTIKGNVASLCTLSTDFDWPADKSYFPVSQIRSFGFSAFLYREGAQGPKIIVDVSLSNYSTENSPTHIVVGGIGAPDNWAFARFVYTKEPITINMPNIKFVATEGVIETGDASAFMNMFTNLNMYDLTLYFGRDYMGDKTAIKVEHQYAFARMLQGSKVFGVCNVLFNIDVTAANSFFHLADNFYWGGVLSPTFQFVVSKLRFQMFAFAFRGAQGKDDTVRYTLQEKFVYNKGWQAIDSLGVGPSAFIGMFQDSKHISLAELDWSQVTAGSQGYCLNNPPEAFSRAIRAFWVGQGANLTDDSLGVNLQADMWRNSETRTIVLFPRYVSAHRYGTQEQGCFRGIGYGAHYCTSVLSRLGILDNAMWNIQIQEKTFGEAWHDVPQMQYSSGFYTTVGSTDYKGPNFDTASAGDDTWRGSTHRYFRTPPLYAADKNWWGANTYIVRAGETDD